MRTGTGCRLAREPHSGQGASCPIARMTSGCTVPGRASVGSFGFSIGTFPKALPPRRANSRIAVNSPAGDRVAVLRGFRGGGGRADRCYAPTAIRRSGEHVELRRRHATCGCSTPDPVAARRAIAAVMTWPKGPANGSQDQRGRLVVCSLTSTSSPRSWLAPTSAQRRTPAAVEQSRVSRPGSRPNPSAGGLSTSVTLLPPRSPLLVLDLDLLLADLLGHPLLVGHGVLVQPDPLPGHDPLLDHRLLLTEDHLMLSLRDLRARGGRVAVGVGDRLTLNPHPLPLDRNGLLHLLGGDVLAQPDPAPLPLGGADPQLLLGAGHSIVSRWPGGVPSHRVSAAGAPGGAVVVEAVVAPQLPLLGL